MDNIRKLKEKLEKDPGSTLFVPLAEEYKKAGMTDEAIEVLRAGIERRPDYMSARVSLGKIYLEGGMLKEAKEEFEKVIAAIPDNLFAHKKLAEIYRQTGEIEKAVDSYSILIALNPTDEEAQAQLKELEQAARTEPPPLEEAPAVEKPAEPQEAPGDFGVDMTPLSYVEEEAGGVEAEDFVLSIADKDALEEVSAEGEGHGAGEEEEMLTLREPMEAPLEGEFGFPAEEEETWTAGMYGEEAAGETGPAGYPGEEEPGAVLTSGEELAARAEDITLGETVSVEEQAVTEAMPEEPLEEPHEVIEEFSLEEIEEESESLFTEPLEEPPLEAEMVSSVEMDEEVTEALPEEPLEEPPLEAELVSSVEMNEEVTEALPEEPLEEPPLEAEMVSSVEMDEEVTEALPEEPLEEPPLEAEMVSSVEMDEEVTEALPEEPLEEPPLEAELVSFVEMETEEEAPAGKPVSLETGLTRADSFISGGDYSEAMTIYRELHAKDPSDKVVLQKMEELKSLLRMLGKDRELLASKLQSFLEAVERRRDEFYRHA